MHNNKVMINFTNRKDINWYSRSYNWEGTTVKTYKPFLGIVKLFLLQSTIIKTSQGRCFVNRKEWKHLKTSKAKEIEPEGSVSQERLHFFFEGFDISPDGFDNDIIAAVKNRITNGEKGLSYPKGSYYIKKPNSNRPLDAVGAIKKDDLSLQNKPFFIVIPITTSYQRPTEHLKVYWTGSEFSLEEPTADSESIDCYLMYIHRESNMSGNTYS